jgi:hypothetical protein
VQDCLENFTLLGQLQPQGQEMIGTQSDACQPCHSIGQNVSSSAMEGKSSTLNCQLYMFDDDSPEEAK